MNPGRVAKFQNGMLTSLRSEGRFSINEKAVWTFFQTQFLRAGGV